MKLKKILKQKEYQQYTTIKIIDINNHWEVTVPIKCLIPKPISKYYKKILKCETKHVHINNNMMLCVTVY